jgi:hypothetical protein
MRVMDTEKDLIYSVTLSKLNDECFLFKPGMYEEWHVDQKLVFLVDYAPLKQGESETVTLHFKEAGEHTFTVGRLRTLRPLGTN